MTNQEKIKRIENWFELSKKEKKDIVLGIQERNMTAHFAEKVFLVLFLLNTDALVIK